MKSAFSLIWNFFRLWAICGRNSATTFGPSAQNLPKFWPWQLILWQKTCSLSQRTTWTWTSTPGRTQSTLYTYEALLPLVSETAELRKNSFARKKSGDIHKWCHTSFYFIWGEFHKLCNANLDYIWSLHSTMPQYSYALCVNTKVNPLPSVLFCGHISRTLFWPPSMV